MSARTSEESAADFLDADLCDHPLENVAAADRLENLRGDSLRDALEAFLHKGFALQMESTVQR